MKKITLLAILFFCSLIPLNAQEDANASNEPKFGIKAGYSSVTLRVTVDETSESEDVSGFYIGFFSEFRISEKFGIHFE